MFRIQQPISPIEPQPVANQFSRSLFFLAVALSGLYLFYHQAIGVFPGDLPFHIMYVNLFVIKGLRAPEVGFQYTLYGLSQLFDISYKAAAIVLLTVMLTALVAIIFKLLKYFLLINDYLCFLFTFMLMTLSSIYLPFFNKNIYLGQGSPNVWHNPTLFMVKPLAFLILCMTIYALNTRKYSYWWFCSLLLFISMFYKPSFGIVFIPSLAIYLLLCHYRDLRLMFYAFLMVLPSIMYAAYQWYSLIKHGNTDFSTNHGESIIFSKFGVLHVYTKNIFVSFLLGLAFPLSVLLFRFKNVISNKYLRFTWVMLLIAYLQMAFLAEYDPLDPIRFVSGNFMWGFLIVMQPLFVFSFIEMYKWFKNYNFKNMTEYLQLRFTALLFILHWMSGLLYTFRVFTGGSGR